MSVIGIDPGVHGAIAWYSPATSEMRIDDMPVLRIKKGARVREVIDLVGLANYFEIMKLYGVELVVREDVNQRPGQTNQFAFGYGVGLIDMVCVMVRLPIETVTPAVWKRVMHVPGKGAADADEIIIRRADELLPEYREKWRGERGGRKVDRAEAAMLAKYAADHLLRPGYVTPKKGLT